MYITIDGPEASGKSTLLAGILAELRAHGFDPYGTKEPGSDNEFCQKIREIVLHTTTEIDRGAEFLAFLADRRQHLSMVVPVQESLHQIVVSDRSMLSGAVYAAAAGLDTGYIDAIVSISGIRVPALSIVTTSSPQFASKVLERRSMDRIERRPADYHIKVDEKFSSLSFDFSKKWNIFRMPPTESMTKQQAVEIAIEQIWKLL